MGGARDTEVGLSATHAADPADALHATQRASTTSRADGVAAQPAPLRQIARFAVLRELGRGAMGVVYAGYDEELDRRVAIKLVDRDEHTRTSQGPAQLLREAQALARLIHPNVVAVFEAGVHEGRVYLAMEYVHGVDLQQWLAAAPRGWKEVAATFLQAGAGLLAAHRVGLVHRDFKPANVLVGHDGRVRVADFGLATARGGPVDDTPVPEDMDLRRSPGAASRRLAATISAPGALVGTPAYMAPEMFDGEPATAATDQFAFCVALFEALYGRLPFAGDSLAALVYQVLHAEPPAAPPDPAVPAWLHAIVLRGLARDPARRFPDLAALLTELARDPEGERRRRRVRWLQLLAAVASTLLVVVGGAAIYRAVVRDVHERRAEARLEVLREQLADLRGAGRDEEAAQVFASFVALADNRGTAALGRAYREWGEAQRDPDAAIDALAAGYVHARTRDDRSAALRGLTLRLAARGDIDAAGVALATLDAGAPELRADPELRELRLTAALWQRDLPAAVAALADPDGRAARILSRLSRATQPRIDDLAPLLADRALSLADLDGDGRPEVLAGAPGRGDGVLQVLRGDATLARISELRVPPLVRPDGLEVPVKFTSAPHLLPGFGGGPRLLVTGENPGDDPLGQWILGILPLTPGAAPELVWTDSKTSPAAADLDRDGAPELYLATSTYSRHLRRLVRDPEGVWRRDAPHPGTDTAHSDIVALTVADLDGDAVPELIAACAGWSAYDVRVFRADGPGLRLVARKTLGAVNYLETVRADGRVRLAAFKGRDYPSERRFPTGDHMGPPAGLYILELAGEALEIVQFVPAGERDVWSRPGAADLDGDGRDELVASDAGNDTLVVFPRDAQGFGEPLRIRGGQSRLVADLDDDPEAEVVIFTQDGHTLVLGAGEAPTPALPRRLPEAPPIRDDLDDPALAEAWRHAEDLAALGLPDRAADEMVAISRLSRDVQADILLRAGELYAAAERHALAASQFTAAAARPDLAERALTGAIASQRALRDYAAAAAHAEAKAELPGLDAAVRAAARAEATALRRAAAVGPSLSLRFDRPLDPGWRIYDPLAVTRDPGSRTLSVQTSTEPVLAELPLEWDGGSVELGVDVALEHLDWGTQIEVSVSRADDDESWFALALRSGGSTTRPTSGASATWGPKSESQGLRHALPAGFTGRVRIHFRHDVELGLAFTEVTPDGAPGVRRFLSGTTDGVPSVPAGPLRLRVRSRMLETQLVGQVEVHAIDLTGFRPGVWPTAAGAATDTARLIAEGEIEPALDRLAGASEGLHGLWRAVLLARLGRDDDAASALARVLRGSPELELVDLENRFEEEPARDRLRQLLLQDPDELHPVARRVLGPALDEVYIVPLLNSVATRPEAIRYRLRDLAPHPLAPPASGDPVINQRHCEGLLLRGMAWHTAGRGDLARRDLEAAWQVLDDGSRAFPLRVDMRRFVGRALLEQGVAAGDVSTARRWLAILLADSEIPEITLESWRERPDLQALLDADAWAELARAR